MWICWFWNLDSNLISQAKKTCDTKCLILINQGVKSGWIIWPQKVHVCRALSSAVNIIDCGSIIWNKKNQTPRRRKGPGSNLRLLLVLIWDFCGFNFACTDSAPDLYLETFSFWNYWLSSRFASTNFLSGEWWAGPCGIPENTGIPGFDSNTDTGLASWEAVPSKNGWVFGKVPNSLWPP